MSTEAITDPPPAPQAPQADDDGWRVERLDLDAYLDRIGYQGTGEPTVRTLTALHRAHLATVPFENLDITLGRGIDPDLDAVQAKIVRDRRGGYCFEANVLFGATLDRLGFHPQRHIARIGDPAVKVAARSHLVLRVLIEGRPWLADVGFGSLLLEPVPLVDGAVLRQGEWAHRVLAGPDDSWRLQGWRGDRWETAYTMTAELAYPVDVEVANHYTATHPRSPFVRGPVVLRKDETAVRALQGRRLTVTYPDATERSSVVADADLAAVLAGLGLSLGEPELTALSRALPPETG